jgi:hypothetical protein
MSKRKRRKRQHEAMTDGKKEKIDMTELKFSHKSILLYKAELKGPFFVMIIFYYTHFIFQLDG